MIDTKKTIRTDVPFGQKVFIKGRGWVKREEAGVEDRLLIARARRLNLEKEFFDAAANLVQKTKALEEIKRDKLYLDVCKTWDEYCVEVLGKSRDSVRLAFRAFDISEKLAKVTLVDQDDQKHDNVVKPLLNDKDLHKMARLPDQEVEVLLDGDLADLPKKIAAKTKARKSQKREFAKTDKELATDIWEKLIARLTAQRYNPGFVKALDEWLTESGF